MELEIACPICKKTVVWSAESLYKPFCSERCKTNDLGEWATNNRLIPADAENDDVTAFDLDRD